MGIVYGFKREVKAAGLSDDRLVELAVYAPQWADFVEQALGWPMLTEAVWWIHAHTKGMDWTVDKEIRELWQADMTARTSLSAADLIEGGVDVAWFHRIQKTLGVKKWEVIYEAAKFASTGGDVLGCSHRCRSYWCNPSRTGCGINSSGILARH